jgi:hypothetical protein
VVGCTNGSRGEVPAVKKPVIKDDDDDDDDNKNNNAFNGEAPAGAISSTSKRKQNTF